MIYQVLARKWRPRTFEELRGQEHVVRALVNAIDHDRIHHAYLFSGTRGVGKTSIARIFAKALNCDGGVSSQPCGICQTCQDIDQGRFVDLLEVDAASRTGVDDTRELLDNVQYSPAKGRYKVYLIDEVHMFSKSSFNALLKTLEEPPPHVKFLLATTDPRKVPITVLSRCLQLNLRRLPDRLIAEQLRHILDRESIEGEAEALRLLSQAADGSMRDALSLLDQAISFGNGSVISTDVASMLGSVDQNSVVELLRALALGDGLALLNVVERLDATAPDYGQVLADLISILQKLAIAQIVPEADPELDASQLHLGSLKNELSPEDVQLYYQIALHGRRDFPLSPDERSGFEMVLLRMLAFRPRVDDAAAGTPVAGSLESRFKPQRSEMTAHGSSSPGTAASLERPKRGMEGKPDPGPDGTDAKSAGKARRALRGLMARDESRHSDVEDMPNAPAAPPLARSEVVQDELRLRALSAEISTDHQQVPVPVLVPDAVAEPPTPPDSDSGPKDAPAHRDWDTLVAGLGLIGVPQQLARHCKISEWRGEHLRLTLDSDHSHLHTPSAEERLRQALESHLRNPIKLSIIHGAVDADTPAHRLAARAAERQRQAEEAIAEDPNVAELRRLFGVSIRRDSISPVG